MQYKIVIGMKGGKCYQKELSEEESKFFMGKVLRETVKGEGFGMSGAEFVITGGSDNAGFPLRSDVPGTGRKKILAISGVGLKKKDHGVRKRKTVAGCTIGEETVQVNLKVVKGEDVVEKAFAPAPEAPAEGSEKAEEKPAEEKSE